MDKSFLKIPSFWASIVKFCFGIICFSLYLHYYEVNLLMCPPIQDFGQGSRTFSYDAFIRECVARAQLAMTACVGFTFVIEPFIIVAYIATAEHFERTPLIQMFSFAGFLAYFIAGCILIQHTVHTTNINSPIEGILGSIQADRDPGHSMNHNPREVQANLSVYNIIGALFIITGLVYVGHFVLAMYIWIKSKL